MNRVLVTGGRGFVGRHVTSALVAMGHEVHAVASRETGGDSGCSWHRTDLLDTTDRRALIASVRPDALVHLAWCARPPHYWSDPENVTWLTASLDLVRTFAEAGGTRMVGAGTCAEYDWTQGGYCTERATPIVPSSLYAAAKAACGSVLEHYGRETGLSVAWARLFFLFGPHDSPLRLIPSLVTTLASGEPARCTSGNHVRDFLFVEDAASAIVALLDSPVTGPINIASGAPARVGDIARAVADRLGRPDLLTVEAGPAEPAVVAGNVNRLWHEVGWRPKHDLQSALDETVRWWRSAEAKKVTA
jgi:nucleoside-diphosphate-sugar epimerase